MLDLILILLLGLAVYRGYRRGLIREVGGLVLLIIAALVAFRTASSSEAFFASWTGSSPLVARMLGAFSVFFLIQLLGSFVLARALRALGPLRPFDRYAGAVVSGVWFVLGAVLFLLVASAVPAGGRFDAALEGSRAARAVAGEDSFVKEAVSTVVGDRVLESLVNLNQLIGDRQVVIEGEDVVDLPPLDGTLEEVPVGAQEVFELLNLARVDAGEDPLSFSEALTGVALSHGLEMYRDGYFSHESPITGDVADRVQAADILYAVVGENLALSPTPQSVHDGLLASPGHRANMLEGRFTRVGIAAIEGPLGLMVVQVFTG